MFGMQKMHECCKCHSHTETIHSILATCFMTAKSHHIETHNHIGEIIYYDSQAYTNTRLIMEGGGEGH